MSLKVGLRLIVCCKKAKCKVKFFEKGYFFASRRDIFGQKEKNKF